MHKCFGKGYRYRCPESANPVFHGGDNRLLNRSLKWDSKGIRGRGGVGVQNGLGGEGCTGGFFLSGHQIELDVVRGVTEHSVNSSPVVLVETSGNKKKKIHVRGWRNVSLVVLSDEERWMSVVGPWDPMGVGGGRVGVGDAGGASQSSDRLSSPEVVGGAITGP